MPFAAAAAATVIGAGVSAYAASEQAGAVDKASKRAIGSQERAQAQLRADLAPYTEAGTNALAPTQALLGLSGPEAAQEAMANYQQSPGYQYQFDQGMRAVQSNAAANGMLNSGATLKALQDRGNQLGNIDFGTYYNRLLQVAQMGQNSAAGVGASGVQTARDNAQTLTSGASAQANIMGNAAQGFGNTANSFANNSMYYNQTQNALYGGQGTGLNYGAGAGGSSGQLYTMTSPSM